MLTIPALLHLWFFQAPEHRSITPRMIPSDRQEIEIVVTGRAYFEHEQVLHELTPGSLLWHRAGDYTLHRNDPVNPYRCLVVAFGAQPWHAQPKISHWRDMATFQPFLTEVLNAYHKDQTDLDPLACYLYGQLRWQCTGDAPTGPAHQRSEDLQRVLNWIDTHFAEPITLQQLAQQAKVSLPHFHTLFKQRTGVSPYQFLLARRLQEARVLLGSTRQSVKQITQATGFADIGNFCRVFRKNTGCTAQEYRARQMER